MVKKLNYNRLYIVLGPLALTAPLTSFLGFYGIPLLSAEVIFLFSILVLIGLIVGLVMALGGNLMQALISSGIIILLVFSETERSLLYLPGIRFRYVLLLSIFLVTLFLYFLREHRVRFLLIVFSAIWLTGWATPNQDITQVSEKSNHLPNASLPPYIHIILDEHIGIEGIPPAFDKNNKFSLKLKKKYIDQGFLVFGRAYSRFFDTTASLSSSLNFQSSSNSADNYSVQIEKDFGFRPIPVVGGSFGFRPNALFETLANRGYIINAFGPNTFSYCDDNATTTIRFGKCVIHGHGLKHFHNEFMILHNYMRKLRLHTMYAAIAQIFGLQEINIAAYPGAFQTVVSANEFIDFLGEGKRGNAYFIHLNLPHSAYVFDEKCLYRDDWNFFKKKEIDETYARYLKQIQCAHVMVDKVINKLNSNPETQDSTIIVSGDHGSRIPASAIYRGPLFSSEEYIQFFSTFFAVHSPSFAPGYDKRPFALDELFKVFSLKEPNLLELESKKEKFVYTLQGEASPNSSQVFTQVTLPPFENGSKVQSW